MSITNACSKANLLFQEISFKNEFSKLTSKNFKVSKSYCDSKIERENEKRRGFKKLSIGLEDCAVESLQTKEKLSFRTKLVTYAHMLQGVLILRKREIPLVCEFEIETINSNSKTAEIKEEAFKFADQNLKI